jgi:HEAT repeat protein
LQRVFNGMNESLKFQACLPLMRDYDDPAAWTYVIEQTASSDANRVRTAFNWIGDTKHCGRTADSRLLAGLAPLLTANSADVRRATAQALGVFAGEEVVRRLIALLGDRDAGVAQQANACLLALPDRQLVAKLLETTLDKTGDQVVQSRGRDLMASLRKTP